MTVPAYTKAEDEAAQQAVQDTVDWLNEQFKILDMGCLLYTSRCV